MIRTIGRILTVDAAAPDGQPSRTIAGVAVPYNVTAVLSSGEKVRFLPGSLPEDGPSPKLIGHHDTAMVLGLVTERVNTDDGMMFTARIARTRAGDDAMELLAMGAYDSVSVGAIPTRYSWDGDVMVVAEAEWPELSIVTIPAFAAATIDSVAASAPEPTESEPIEPEPDPEDTMPEDTNTDSTVTASAPVPVPLYATAARPVTLPSPAEYLAAAAAGGNRFTEMQARVRAAAPDVTTTDTPGLLPTPIVGVAYDNYVGTRPVIDAVGVRALPMGSGKVFIRPEITTHTSIAVQSTENTAVQSGTFVVSSNQVTRATYGGYANVSLQDVDMTDPNIMALILSDMGKIYGHQTDNVAADNMVSGATTTRNFTDANIDDPTEWLAWVYGAAETILTASNGNLPTHLFVSPDIWSAMGQLEDGSGRPLFVQPAYGPMNAIGDLAPGSNAGTAFGLRVVVDRNFATDTLIIADPSGYEIFEQQVGSVMVDNPSTLSRTVSWYGYFATLMIDPAKFIKAAFI